jgi:hypothetical protein
MKAERVITTNGIDDIKLIGETESERLFIKQLAESGTLSCLNAQVGDTVSFRPISVMPDISSFNSTRNSIGKVDFTVRQNQQYDIDFTFKKDDEPIALTDYTAIKLQVKRNKSSSAIIELSLGNGLVISGDDSNILKTSFTAAQTKTLSCQTYYYDVLMVKPTSNTYYIEGTITVKATGTR